jgi:hypothetical protein
VAATFYISVHCDCLVHSLGSILCSFMSSPDELMLPIFTHKILTRKTLYVKLGISKVERNWDMPTPFMINVLGNSRVSLIKKMRQVKSF